VGASSFGARPLNLAPGYGASGPGLGDWPAVAERLAEARNYWIVSVRADGRPHAAPVWGVWLDDAVWFSTDAASVKGRNLAAQPEVVVHLESGDDVVIVEGRVGPAPAERFEAYRAEYRRKYDFEHPDLGAPGATVFMVTPSRILTWREQEFPASGVAWTPEE
jgi:pyridoxine/pyridoxamine 5'-phosphate oxidase